MSVELYYFSGTGNSLFVAKELQKKVPNSVIIPIVSLLHKDVIQTNGKIIGIIFSCHALTIPVAVKQFIRKLDVHSAEYVFAIAMQYGTVFKGFSVIKKLLDKKKKTLNSHFIINMCHNESPRSEKGYTALSKSLIIQIENKVHEKIKIIDKKPVWQRSVLCYMCYACLNYCPKDSVQVKDIFCVKSYTTENGRYPHPYGTVNDNLIQKKIIGN